MCNISINNFFWCSMLIKKSDFDTLQFRMAIEIEARDPIVQNCRESNLVYLGACVRQYKFKLWLHCSPDSLELFSISSHRKVPSIHCSCFLYHLRNLANNLVWSLFMWKIFPCYVQQVKQWILRRFWVLSFMSYIAWEFEIFSTMSNWLRTGQNFILHMAIDFSRITLSAI